MPSGTIAVGVGLAVLGVTSYAFLGIASRALDASSFARLGIVWTVLFTLGPGAFLPLEQEIGRRLAVISDPERAAVVLRRAAGVGLILAAAVTAASFAAIEPIRNRLLNGDLALFGAMIMANLALAPVHISRGVLAGTGRFGRYGAQLATDGTLRVAGAAALSAVAVHRAADFGWVLVGSQLIAVAATATYRMVEMSSVSTMARGISRCGTLASSTTLAKSSNPMKAKNASKLAKAMPDSTPASTGSGCSSVAAIGTSA